MGVEAPIAAVPFYKKFFDTVTGRAVRVTSLGVPTDSKVELLFGLALEIVKANWQNLADNKLSGCSNTLMKNVLGQLCAGFLKTWVSFNKFFNLFRYNSLPNAIDPIF